MFGSDWFKRYSTQLVGTVILAALLAAAVPTFLWGVSKQAEYERYADKRRQEYTANSYSPERQRCFRLAAGFQHDCVTKAKQEYDAYNREQQDLVAQRVTALWTFIMGCAAIVGMALSAFGVFLVWTTFNATKEGNEIARNTAKQQLRAYLHPHDPILERVANGRKPLAKVNVKNYGQTPATHVSSVIYFDFKHVSFEHSEDEADISIAISAAPLAPGASLNQEAESLQIFGSTEFGLMAAETHSIFVYGKVTYWDAFEGQRETHFRFMTEAKTGFRLRVCAKGNKVT